MLLRRWAFEPNRIFWQCSGGGNRQNPANRLNPMIIVVIFDELDHFLNGRSSSACAKYAEALRRISLACFSSQFSRSYAFIFSAISGVMPPRWPVSTSTFLTHSFSVLRRTADLRRNRHNRHPTALMLPFAI